MDGTDIVRLVGLIGFAILVIPGVIYSLRDRRRAVRNAVIWLALTAVAALLFWLLTRPR